MLHTYIYLERCLQILLWLAGTPIVFLSFLKEKLPKAEELKDINPHPQPLHLPPQFPKFCHYISLTEIICGKAAQNRGREFNQAGGTNKFITWRV